MLYFAWLLLVARAEACVTSKSSAMCATCAEGGLTQRSLAQLDFSAALVPCASVVTQLEVPSLRLDHKFSPRQVERAGDILEAVGGIFHPWKPDALLARTHLVGPHFSQAEFHEARNMLGTLAKRCQWLVQYAGDFRCEPVQAFQDLLGNVLPIIVIGEGGCPTCEMYTKHRMAPPCSTTDQPAPARGQRRERDTEVEAQTGATHEAPWQTEEKAYVVEAQGPPEKADGADAQAGVGGDRGEEGTTNSTFRHRPGDAATCAFGHRPG